MPDSTESGLAIRVDFFIMKTNEKGQFVHISQVGNTFGTAKCVRFHEKKPNGSCSYWMECECGTEYTAWAESLKKGTGRWCKECRRKRISEARTTHGKRYTRKYMFWSSMKARCNPDPNQQNYGLYAGRGISMCQRWMESFDNFDADMPDPPNDALSIDRIDNNGNYEPGNCRWATKMEQANNRRTNVLITFNGKTQTISQWSRELPLDKTTIRKRLLKGWPIEKVLSTQKFHKSENPS